MTHEELRAELDANPPTEQELKDELCRAALELRRVRLKLEGFGAGPRATRVLDVPRGVFERAVERLAAFQEARDR